MHTKNDIKNARRYLILQQVDTSKLTPAAIVAVAVSYGFKKSTLLAALRRGEFFLLDEI